MKGITCNGGLGTSEKILLSYKSNYIFKCYQYSFVVLYIVSCVAAIRLNNFEFKLLPFLLDDFLGLCGGRRSRGLIYIMLM